MKGKSLIAIVSLLLTLFSACQIHQSASLPANSMWTSPENQIIRWAWQKFNVTIWLNVTTPTRLWISYLTYNRNQLGITRSGFTGEGQSQWAEPFETYPGVFTGTHNTTHNYISFQEYLKNGGVETGAGTLAWIEFQMLVVPTGSDVMGEMRLDIGGLYSSTAQDWGFNDIPLDFGKTSYVFRASVAPPKIEILSPQNLTYETLSPQNLIGIPLIFTINDTVSWMGYSLNGESNATIYGNTSLTLPYRHYSIIVYANSTSGNMSCSERVYFSVEISPPSSTWTVEDGIRLEGGWTGNSIIVKLDNETYRMYAGDCLLQYYPLGGVFRSAISTDLLTWTWESGIRIGYGNGGEDGCVDNGDVMVLPNGTYRMYYGHPYYDQGSETMSVRF